MAIGLVVKQGFADYAQGTVILDQAVVALILVGPERQFVTPFDHVPVPPTAGPPVPVAAPEVPALVVTGEFDGHHIGDVLTDPATVAAVEAGPNHNDVAVAHIEPKEGA